MPGRVAHLAFNSDDDSATRRFCEALFEWSFEPYLPGFVRTPVPPAAEVVVAVQGRRDLVPGTRSTGPEVTIEVDDLGAVLSQVAGLGGRIVMERVTIPTVGDLALVADPSQNVVGVIQYA